MNKRRSVGIAVILLLTLPLVCFGQDATTEATPKYEPEEEPNLIVSFESINRIFVDKPMIYTEEPLDLESLEILLGELELGRELAIVTMSREWSLQSEEEKQSDLEKIEALLKIFGFKEVRIKQVVSDDKESYILRE